MRGTRSYLDPHRVQERWHTSRSSTSSTSRISATTPLHSPPLRAPCCPPTHIRTQETRKHPITNIIMRLDIPHRIPHAIHHSRTRRPIPQGREQGRGERIETSGDGAGRRGRGWVCEVVGSGRRGRGVVRADSDLSTSRGEWVDGMVQISVCGRAGDRPLTRT